MARSIGRLAAVLALSGMAACITPQLPEPGKTSPTPAPVLNTPPTVAVEAPVPSGAATPPANPVAPPVKARDLAAEATHVAMRMLGKPYLRGGNTPKGFDCSGLVHYSFAQLGQDVPRDTAGLLGASRPISNAELKFGDLVFFHIRRRQNSHVGLYIGDGQFVHAPASGGQVRKENMSLAYWSQHFAGARRLPIAPKYPNS